ncbi:hypothetical protein AALB64_15750, partial [Lachnospiraceae bacterium 45-P1]
SEGNRTWFLFNSFGCLLITSDNRPYKNCLRNKMQKAIVRPSFGGWKQSGYSGFVNLSRFFISRDKVPRILSQRMVSGTGILSDLLEPAGEYCFLFSGEGGMCCHQLHQ